MKKKFVITSTLIFTLLATGCSAGLNDEWEVINNNEMRNKKTGVHYYCSRKIFWKEPICPIYLFNGQVKTSADIEPIK